MVSFAREIQERVSKDLGERYGESVSEEARLMQQINGAAQQLHQLRSEQPEDMDRLRRPAQVAGLQAKIDRLYERKRELIAARGLLRGDPSASAEQAYRRGRRLVAAA